MGLDVVLTDSCEWFANEEYIPLLGSNWVVHVCVSMCACVCVYVCASMCVCVRACLCAYLCVYVHAWVCVSVCTLVCTRVCVWVCVYAHTLLLLYITWLQILQKLLFGCLHLLGSWINFNAADINASKPVCYFFLKSVFLFWLRLKHWEESTCRCVEEL